MTVLFLITVSGLPFLVRCKWIFITEIGVKIYDHQLKIIKSYNMNDGCDAL